MHSILLANPQITDQTLWLIVGVAGLLLLYILMRPRKRKEPLDTAPRFSLARQRGVEQQMHNLLVELSEMSRRISAQLDTRSTRLELLIKEADEKLSSLRAALDGEPPAPREIVSAENPARSDTSDAIEPELVLPDVPAALPPVDQRHTEVYALADDGRSANEIARLLNRSMGEIELILALRPH